MTAEASYRHNTIRRKPYFNKREVLLQSCFNELLHRRYFIRTLCALCLKILNTKFTKTAGNPAKQYLSLYCKRIQMTVFPTKNISHKGADATSATIESQRELNFVPLCLCYCAGGNSEKIQFVAVLSITPYLRVRHRILDRNASTVKINSGKIPCHGLQTNRRLGYRCCFQTRVNEHILLLHATRNPFPTRYPFPTKGVITLRFS